MRGTKGAKGAKGLLGPIKIKNPFKRKATQQKTVNVSIGVPKNPYVLNTSTLLNPLKVPEYKPVFPENSKRPLPPIPFIPPVTNTRKVKYKPEVYSKLSTKSEEGRISPVLKPVSNENGFSRLSSYFRETNENERSDIQMEQQMRQYDLKKKKKILKTHKFLKMRIVKNHIKT